MGVFPGNRDFNFMTNFKNPLKDEKTINILIIVVFLVNIAVSGLVMKSIEALPSPSYDFSLSLIQGNSLAASKSALPVQTVQTIKMVVTAYSSTVWQTDSTPFITAAGTEVKDGIVANNLLPFGTEIRIPELYGNKVFVVEDRMNRRKGFYHLDIWFPEYSQAKDFGAKNAYIEVLES